MEAVDRIWEVSPGTAKITASTTDGSGVSGSMSISVNTFHRETRLNNWMIGSTHVNNLVQGLAVGGTYCYSFEVSATATPGINDGSVADEEHALYRYSTSLQPKMTIKSPYSRPRLGHANDATLASYTSGGVNSLLMYVAAYNRNGTGVVIGQENVITKLEYNSSGEYYEKAIFTYPTSVWRIGGVSRKSGGGTDSHHVLLLKSDRNFYEVSVPANASGTTSLPTLPSNYFSILYAYGTEDYSNYTAQSFHYEPVNGGTIYVPMWGGGVGKPNENVILVYHGIDNTTTKNIKATERYFIKNTNKPNGVFEIEAIGFRGNTLWFSTNEATIPDDVYARENGGIYTDSQNIK